MPSIGVFILAIVLQSYYQYKPLWKNVLAWIKLKQGGVSNGQEG